MAYPRRNVDGVGAAVHQLVANLDNLAHEWMASAIDLGRSSTVYGERRGRPGGEVDATPLDRG
jgi:hypothetical protein